MLIWTWGICWGIEMPRIELGKSVSVRDARLPRTESLNCPFLRGIYLLVAPFCK